MKKAFLIGLLFLMAISFDALGYEPKDGDFQFWNTYSVETVVAKRWKIKIEEEMRYGDDLGVLYYMHTDGGFNYKLNDWFDIGANYRLIEERHGDDWRMVHVPHLNAMFTWEWQDFKITDNSRIEYRIIENAKDDWRYRNKLTLYGPWKWTRYEITPYIADEVFWSWTNGEINKNRLAVGLQANITENWGGDLYYMWQTTDKGKRWYDDHILGATVKAKF